MAPIALMIRWTRTKILFYSDTFIQILYDGRCTFFLGGGICTAHQEVVVTEVVGFSRTVDGHNHRQGTTSCTEPGHSTGGVGTDLHGVGARGVGRGAAGAHQFLKSSSLRPSAQHITVNGSPHTHADSCCVGPYQLSHWCFQLRRNAPSPHPQLRL